MGLFGGGNSSSSTTNVTEVENVGGSDGSLVANQNSSINVLDAGAIQQAFGFASRFASESLGLVERNAGAAQTTLEHSLASSLATADAEKTGSSQRLLYLGLAMAAAFAVFVWVKR